MEPSDLINLTAFLNALPKLDGSLPADIQTQLNQIGKDFQSEPSQIDQLNELTKRYQPLRQLYQKERIAIREASGVRNKGLPPQPIPNEATQELTNSAIDIFTAPDSVDQAKTKTNPNLMQRIWQTIRGKN